MQNAVTNAATLPIQVSAKNTCIGQVFLEIRNNSRNQLTGLLSKKQCHLAPLSVVLCAPRLPPSLARSPPSSNHHDSLPEMGPSSEGGRGRVSERRFLLAFRSRSAAPNGSGCCQPACHGCRGRLKLFKESPQCTQTKLRSLYKIANARGNSKKRLSVIQPQTSFSR